MTLTQVTKAGLHDIALDHVFTIGASGTDHYTFQGEGLNGTVNDPTLYLTRGKTYRFENGTGAHAIRIQSADDGTSGTLYNTGVTNNNTTGTVIVEVQHDAPDVLYYQCANHANMKGTIYITGALADGNVTTAKIADDAVTDAKLANSINTAIAANTAKTSNATHTGDVTGSTSLTIAADAVTEAKIANGAVTINKLATNAVDNSKIGPQAVTLSRIINGTSSEDGKFLRANNGASPTFESVPSPAITGLNGAGNTRIITSDGGTTVTAADSLTFDGQNLSQTITVDGKGIVINAGDIKPMITGNANRAGAGNTILGLSGKWNGTEVARIAVEAGSDTTNKDDGTLNFSTTKSGQSLTKRMTIDSDGRVGINRTDMTSHDSDAQTLVVGNDANNNRAGITIHSSGNQAGTIYFADGTGSSSYRGRINYYHNTDQMCIGAGGSNNGIKIDSNCVVTTPSRPAFMAKLGQNGTVQNGYRAFTSSDGLLVGGNQGHYMTRIDYNVGSHYNSSTTRFTAPIDGLYFFEVQLATNGSAPASNYFAPEIYINGTRYYGGWQNQDGGYQKVKQGFFFELSANDYVEPGYESAQTVDVYGSNSSTLFYTFFTGYLIG